MRWRTIAGGSKQRDEFKDACEDKMPVVHSLVLLDVMLLINIPNQ